MLAIKVLLAEHAGLRAEIDRRSSDQSRLIALMVTSIGAIGGLVLAQRTDPLLILMLPILAAVLGNLYTDNDRAILHISWYIAEYLRPRAVEATGWTDALLWEIEAAGPQALKRRPAWALSVVITFFGAGLIALVFALLLILDEGSPAWAWSIWAIDLVALSWLGYRLARVVSHHQVNPDRGIT